MHAPGVAIHCLFGTGIETPDAFHYNVSENWFDTQPVSIEHGDGDGTVNIRSLLGCQRWIEQQNEPVTVKSFDSVTHRGILNDQAILDHIGRILSEHV